MGGGGDGGYAQKQAAQEADKQKARDALNAMFGIGTASAPTREQFNRSVQVGNGEDGYGTTTEFDQAGYDKALADFNTGSTDIAKNKAARDALYQKVRDDVFAVGNRQLGERRGDAQRDLKFELFAKGLDGGSVDVDQSALLGRTYNQGILDLGARSDASKTELMGKDEQARLGLLQSIDAGMDQGSALSSALNQMRVNSDRATSEAQGESIGDLFGDAGLLYTRSRRSQGRQAAQGLYPEGWWRTPDYSPGVRKGSSGVISSTGG